ATPVRWSQTVTRKDGEATRTWIRRGIAEGDTDVDGHAQHWVVYLTATRTEGRVASLDLIETRADGTVSTHPLGFRETKADYRIELPAGSLTSGLTLGHTSAAPDGGGVTEGAPIPTTLGPDGSRTLKVTLNGVTYTVHVTFARPAATPTATAARLSGIYVNKAGHTVRGDLIDGWNPDTLDYTIRIRANAPGVYVLPVAPNGVTVSAGDVRQSAYATTQYWTVRAANGQTRTYSVTVVRDHEPTAAERFAPAAPVDRGGDRAAPSPSTAGLRDHGYVLHGRYVAVTATSYTIPEGGTVAWRSWQGQTVRPTVTRGAGMTWTYVLDTLSPDGTHAARTTLTVTYLTDATHRAGLTGLLVNGRRLDGFDPTRRDWTVLVADPAHWTVSPVFDRTSGMSAVTRKRAGTALIRVT
ncbi:cell surface protein, partial [Bifidobacterium margollesii]